MGTYRTHRAACPQGPTYCTYGVRVPASAVRYVPRTVAPQATPASCSSSRTSSPSTCTCSWASSAAKLCRATGRAPAAATTGSARPLHEKAGSHTSWPSERAAPSGHPWRNDMVHAPCFECWLHGTCTFQTRVSVIVVGSPRACNKSSVDISPLVQGAVRTERVSTRVAA